MGGDVAKAPTAFTVIMSPPLAAVYPPFLEPHKGNAPHKYHCPWRDDKSTIWRWGGGGRYRVSSGLSIRVFKTTLLSLTPSLLTFPAQSLLPTLSHALTFRGVNSIWWRQGNEILQGLTLPHPPPTLPATLIPLEIGKQEKCTSTCTHRDIIISYCPRCVNHSEQFTDVYE